MSLRSLESAILAELRTVADNPKIRLKDIMAWQTGDTLAPQEGETYFYLPELHVSVAVKWPERKKGSPR